MISQHLLINFLAGNPALPGGPSPNPSGAKGGFADIFQTALKGAAGKTALLQGGPSTGLELLQKLKAFFTAQGISLDTLSADAEALDALKGFLLDAGFDAARVTRLLEELKGAAGREGLKVSDLFARLSELEQTPDTDAEADLDSSALPCLESILSLFNVPAETISRVMEKAKVNGEGIDLEALIARLKAALSGAEGGEFAPANPKALEQVRELMAQMGLEAGEAVLSFQDFLQQLKTLSQDKADRGVALDRLVDDLGRFSRAIQVDPAARADAAAQKAHATEAELQSALHVKSKGGVNPENGDGSPLSPAAAAQGKATPKQALKAQAAPEGEAASLPKEVPPAPTAETASKGKPGLEAWNAAEPRPDALPRGESRGAGSFADHFALEQPAQDAIRENRLASAGQSESRPLPRFVMEQVERRILTAALKGENEISLRLNPPDLGRLHMSIEHYQDRMKVNILAENPATRDLLLSQTADLKTLLLEHGMQLDKLDVQVSLNFEQSLGSARQDARHGRNRRRGGAGDGEATEAGRTAENAAASRGLRPEGIIELIA